MSEDDRTAVRSATPEDRRSRFETLYAAHYESIASYSARRCDTAEDAADVVAETFLIAWRRLDRVPTDRSALIWLYATARRVLANQRRGQKRRQGLLTRLRAVASGSAQHAPHPDRDDPDRPAAIIGAFGRLSAADRELLRLVAWEGLTPSEAAVVLGRSAGGVRVQLHRARARFARLLANEGVEL
ncbi:RNA polymerase sigma factor [Micromonospora sp. NPDC093277]|uniref:RNA polymerase sigma factor n=1 Tax=Micromonospora sp. NPDC093277 TaxID=3364291 RepID=UPI00380F4C17